MAWKAVRRNTWLATCHRFPLSGLSRFPERDAANYRVFKDIETTNDNFEGGANGCFGNGQGPEAIFHVDLPPDFSGPQGEVARKEGDNRRRSLGMDAGENRFLGGSDPTLSGLSAAQRLRHRGSLPPKLPRRFPCSVAREVQADQPTDLNP